MKRPVAALAVLSLALAQTPPPAQPDTVIRINVNLVQVDAVVTDANGNPVPGLKAEDFEIRQDGKPQTITHFSYVSGNPRVAAPAVSPRPSPKKSVPPPPPPPSKLRPQDARRTLALVVDDLGLSFESTFRVRESLKKFVDRELQPGDLVAIIRTGAGIGALQQFTTDRRQLDAAIERVRFNAMGRVGISSFAPLGSDDGGSMEQERSEIFSVGTLGAVRYVVDGLRELPGRKSVILFSENLQIYHEKDGTSPRVMDSLRRLVDAANRSSVVIYSIDPRGLQTYGLTAADDTRDISQRPDWIQKLAQVPSDRAEQVFRSQDGLVALAHDTGGLFLHDRNDIEGALRQALEDSRSYYLLGYRPDASTFDPRTGQARFHRVSVRVKRPGLHVRTRSGFFGDSDQGPQAVPRTPQEQMLRALTSPFSSGDIHVRLTALFSNGTKVGSFLSTLLYIDGKDLKFTDEPDGSHKAVLEVLATTFGDNGQPIDFSSRTYTLHAREQAYRSAVERGLIYSVRHPVKKPGAYQMRVVVRDDASERVGSAAQFIEVPDVGKGRLTLSSMMAKEQPKASGAGTAATDEKEGQVEEDDPMGSSAVRVFKPGAAVMYGYQILNARLDSNHRTALESQSRLFCDGKEVYTGRPIPLDLAGQPDPAHLMAGGVIKLGPKMAPGDYVLQIVVTDKLANEKYRTASQWVDFEVR